jgi:hypothetical protein
VFLRISESVTVGHKPVPAQGDAGQYAEAEATGKGKKEK